MRDCLEYGPTAPQPNRANTLIPEPTSDGDSYLNLNVFAPRHGAKALPVLGWVHGGGFLAAAIAAPGIEDIVLRATAS